MCHTEAVATRAAEDARDFLSYCRNLAASRPGQRTDPALTLFATALLDWARHPPLPEGVVIQVTTPCRVSTDATAFHTIHRALHALLVRYGEWLMGRLASRPAFNEQDWMALAAAMEATRAFEPFLTAEQVLGLWAALGKPAKRFLGAGFDRDRISRFILPPNPFRLALVVNMLARGKMPAIFAIELPNGALQPIGDWLQDHWQETEQIHILSEQWNAMVEACFSAYRAEINFCNPFVVSEALANHLRSEVCSEQLAWFNCTLRGNIPKHVTAQEIEVRCKVGDGPFTGMGVFNAQALLDFSYEVIINGKRLTDAELASLLETDQNQELTFGSNILSPNLVCDLRSQLQALQRFDPAQSGRKLSLFEGLQLLSGLPVRGGEAPTAQFCRFQKGRQLERLLSGNVQTMPDLPEATDNALMNYQREGVRFLWEGTARGLGVCLADDMGLGKTLQVIALLQLWKRSNLFAELPALVIMPPTLLKNWQAELQRWAPELTVKICYSLWMEDAAWQQLKERPDAVLRGVDVALFSYQMIPKLERLTTVEFPAIILDEAQAIKSPVSNRSVAVRALHGARRIVLTGTPVENSLQDLWTIFDFLNRGLLGPQKHYQQTKHQPEAFVVALRKLVKPFLLRREKTVLRLPAKTEQMVPCDLTPIQVVTYRTIVEELREGIEEVRSNKALEETRANFKRGGLVLRNLVRLKQLCNHPAQLSPSSAYLPEQSGKFIKLLELTGKIVASNEKFLLFTQFRKVIDPLHKLLSETLGCPGFVLHGSTSVAERSRRVEDFQNQAGPAFFIISLRAGGMGLNLTAATHVIHFDRWWNPAVENQATDRVYRIGQTRPVTVHKFVCRGTIEDRIDALIQEKLALTEDLFSEGPEKLLYEMSNEELLNLFRYDTDTPVAEERR